MRVLFPVVCKHYLQQCFHQACENMSDIKNNLLQILLQGLKMRAISQHNYLSLKRQTTGIVTLHYHTNLRKVNPEGQKSLLYCKGSDVNCVPVSTTSSSL